MVDLLGERLVVVANHGVSEGPDILDRHESVAARGDELRVSPAILVLLADVAD